MKYLKLFLQGLEEFTTKKKQNINDSSNHFKIEFYYLAQKYSCTIGKLTCKILSSKIGRP